MKRCKVIIPFHLKATDTIYVPGDIIEVSEEQLAKIKAIDENMVSVLGDCEAAEKPKAKRTKKQ